MIVIGSQVLTHFLGAPTGADYDVLGTPDDFELLRSHLATMGQLVTISTNRGIYAKVYDAAQDRTKIDFDFCTIQPSRSLIADLPDNQDYLLLGFAARICSPLTHWIILDRLIANGITRDRFTTDRAALAEYLADNPADLTAHHTVFRDRFNHDVKGRP